MEWKTEERAVTDCNLSTLRTFSWQSASLSLSFSAHEDSPVKMTGLAGRGMKLQDFSAFEALPIVEILSPASGRTMNHQRLSDTQVGSHLHFVSAKTGQDEHERVLEIIQHSDVDNIDVSVVFAQEIGVSAVRCSATIHANAHFVAESVSSLYLPVPLDEGSKSVGDVTAYWADSSWAAENNWHSQKLRDGVLTDIDTVVNPRVPSNRFRLSSHSTWSTGEWLPLGMVEVPSTQAVSGGTFSMMWQVENNGPWSWEIGEGLDGLHVLAGGPNFDEHQWAAILEAGQEFQTVPVSMAVCAGTWRDAAEEMTLQRRALVAQGHRVGGAEIGAGSWSKVVYNDYMNTLFGDPTLEKEAPLIEAAGRVGADIFCVDAGWYDSNNGSWWDSVGEWEPSTNRFGAEGLAGIARRVEEAGMGLGLWLEPEVVGVKSPMARKLPDSAFFCRFGQRVADDGRYLLDLRSAQAREHLDATVDRLVREFNVKFFKFDYNSVPGIGTQVDSNTLGEGLFAHTRAYLQWVDSLRSRYPDVMIENCGSGAMRSDYAMLSRFDLQSTSDQCNPQIYAAIASGASLSVLPEQQGNWGYAQQEMDMETASFTLAAGILGRLYLSGFINRMDEQHLNLVRTAIELQREVLKKQKSLIPWWPLGLPRFNAEWQAVGLCPQTPNSQPGYMTLWNRGSDRCAEIDLPQGAELEQVFPLPHTDTAEWSLERVDSTTLRVSVPGGAVSARVFKIHYSGAHHPSVHYPNETA